MRRCLVVAAVAAAALVLSAAAAAKGPTGALLSGPGLEGAVQITGQGEGGAGTPLGTLVDSGGFFAQVFGQAPDPTMRTRPSGTLGPRYKVVYLVPGPNSVRSRLVQLVYPYAKPGPLTYMKPGQQFWNGRKAHGGWYAASAALRRMLIRAGLPARA